MKKPAHEKRTTRVFIWLARFVLVLVIIFAGTLLPKIHVTNILVTNSQSNVDYKKPRILKSVDDVAQNVIAHFIVLRKGYLFGVNIRPHKRTALDFRGECLNQIRSCLTSQERSFPNEPVPRVDSTWADTCIPTLPTCATDDWRHERDCCPAACVATYNQIRPDYTDPNDAFEIAFLRTDSCYPGYEQWSK